MQDRIHPVNHSWWTRYPVKKDWAAIGAILLLATFLRFHGLNEPGLWLDEVSYTRAAQSPIFDQIFAPGEALSLSFDPVLSAIPFSLAFKLGFATYILRYPAALFGILSVAILYRLSRTLFGNIVGLITALLLATSSFHILYSQEARSYSQLVFFSIASFWFFFRAIETSRVKYWGLFVFFTWAGISSHYVMAFTIVVQGIFLVLVSLPQILSRDHKGTIKQTFKVFIGFLLSLMAIFFLRLPWLGNFAARLDLTEGGASSLTLYDSLLRSIQALTSNNFTIQLLFVILAGVGLILALYHFPKRGVFLACWLVLSIPITQIGLWYVAQLYTERHNIWGLPAFLMASACGLVGISNLAKKYLVSRNRINSSRTANHLEFLFIGCFVILLAGNGLWQAQQNPTRKQNWPLGLLEEATRYLAAASENGAVIIGVPNAQHLKFYLQYSRPDLTYLDASSTLMPAELPDRWYVFYEVRNIPARWQNELSYREFHDILVLHLPGRCPLATCLDEATTLLSEVVQANPESTIAQKAGLMLSGLSNMADY